MKKLLYISILGVCSFFIIPLHAETKLTLRTHITDTANIIPDDIEATLEAKLTAFEASTSNQIAIVTVQKLASDETIETAAYNIFNENKLGQKDKNNGMLFLIALEDRKNRFETGYGLEPYVPDVFTGRLQRDVLAPAFREGKYGQGIDSAIDSIIQQINTQEPYTETKTSGSFSNIDPNIFFFLIFILFSAFRALAASFAKSKSIIAGGVWGLVLGAIGYFITGTVFFFGLIILGLIIDALFSYNPGLAKIINRSGRNGFFGGSFGRGGGGFSGGGGLSGGGGSSGNW